MPKKPDFDWWMERARLLKGAQDEVEKMFQVTGQAYQVGPWAIMKLALLGYYIQIYVRILGSSGTINYVDLFAGPGINEIKGTSQRIMGSAVLARKAPEKNRFTNVVLCELNSDYANSLRTLLPDAKVINEDINKEGLTELIDFLGSNRGHSLVFADPEGLELHYETLAKIFQVTYCDVLINYQPSSVNRVLGQVAQTPRMEESLTDFFGTPDWKDFGGGDRLLELYCSQIKKFREVVVPVRVQGTRLFHYYIILATRKVVQENRWVTSFQKARERVERVDANTARNFIEIITGNQAFFDVGESS